MDRTGWSDSLRRWNMKEVVLVVSVKRPRVSNRTHLQATEDIKRHSLDVFFWFLGCACLFPYAAVSIQACRGCICVSTIALEGSAIYDLERLVGIDEMQEL